MTPTRLMQGSHRERDLTLVLDIIDALHYLAPVRLPSAYGPWQSVYTRFSRWSSAGVLARLFDSEGLWKQEVGSTVEVDVGRPEDELFVGCDRLHVMHNQSL